MGKSKTPSFIFEAEISFSDTLLNELYPVKHKGESFFRLTGGKERLDKAIKVANSIYNTALNQAIHRKNIFEHDPAYIEARNKYAACKKADMEIPKDIIDAMNDAKTRAGFSDYSLQTYIKAANSHYSSVVGSMESQKLAARAFDAVNKMVAGNARRVSFHKWNDDIALEGKSELAKIKYVGHNCIQYGKGNVYPLIIKKNDTYAIDAMKHQVKYVRIIRREIRGRMRYFAQLVLEGTPPKTKNLVYGRKNSKVGLDEGVSTIAVCSAKEVSLMELAPNTAFEERELRIINRAMDRSRRATNPDNYNPDGTIKKGKKSWYKSKRYKNLASIHKDIYRKLAWKRKCSHNTLANHIVSLGCDIRVETMRISALAKRSKKTTYRKQNGRANSKKRYGKTIQTRAPAMLISAIDRKLKYIGFGIKKIDTAAVKASQYDHKSDTFSKKQLSDRWGYIGSGKEKVQRDLYSAFLIMNTNGTLDAVDRTACLRTYANFKKLHDKAVASLQDTNSKTLQWYVA